MKYLKKTKWAIVVLGLLTFTAFTACSTDDTQAPLDDLENNSNTQKDKDALLFMLEEEKLARDTYDYLDDLYNMNQFSNIKRSEQSHMDAVVNLLEQYAIPYTIFPDGQFANQDIQDFYDQFVAKGAIDSINALEVGAAIEDLDIVDLETFMADLSNSSVLSVFELLQCGSRNHLRSFTSALEISGSSYTPQFLTTDEYNLIVNDTNEQCGR